MTAPATTLDFLDSVRRSGVLGRPALDEYLARRPEMATAPAGRAAAVLVRDGLLTPFQARQLLAGKTKGFRLGAYVVRDLIGRGGMGAVYLAEHETLRRRVAVKVLTGVADRPDPLAVGRFLREARAAAALDHPNIVRIFDVSKHGDTHYLVMEFVDGKTLDKVAAAGPVAAGRAVDYIAQAAAGLQHAHEKGFVHRDVKPANLILAKDGTVKLLDLGLARSFDNAADNLTGLLDRGAVVGTADFIAPEQALGDAAVDIRADIYSLGVTFHVLITGRPPFGGSTAQKLLAHQIKAAPSLAAADRTFPPELAGVVEKMMAKQPADRYSTPAEVITALAPWLQASGRLLAGVSGTKLGQGDEFDTINAILTASTDRLPRPSAVTLGKASSTPWLGSVGAGPVAGRPAGRPRSSLLSVLAAGLLPVVGAGLFLLTRGSDGPPAAPPAGPAAQVAAPQPPVPPPAPPAPAPARAPTPPLPPPPAPMSAGPALVYALDFAAFKPFAFRWATGGTREVLGGDPDILPQGFFAGSWGADDEAEVRAVPADGRVVLEVSNVRGHTAQFAFELEAGLGLRFAPGKSYRLVVEYRATAGTDAQIVVSDPKTAEAKMAVVPMPPTDGRWREVEARFGHDADRPDGLWRAILDNKGTAPGNALAIRKFEVTEQE